MGRALRAVAAFASLLLLLSCQKTPPAAKALRPSVADEKNGFCVMADLPVLDIADGKLTTKSSLQIGEKVALPGQTTKAVQAGKGRDFVKVRRDSGTEGWARAEYIVARSILAVTTEESVIYSDPRNTGATTATVPPMTILAIHSDSGGQAFIRVTGYDQSAKVLLKGVLLKNEGVSARPDDVQAVILLQLAAASKNAKQREAFLSSALKDHPGSAFLPQLQDALAALKAPPPPVEKAADAYSAVMAAAEDAVAVRDSPDETSGKVVATLAKGQGVDVEEKTRDADTIGNTSAPWYRIREPAGWVFGASLSSGQ